MPALRNSPPNLPSPRGGKCIKRAQQGASNASRFAQTSFKDVVTIKQTLAEHLQKKRVWIGLLQSSDRRKVALRSRHPDLFVSCCGQPSIFEGRSPRGPCRNMRQRNGLYPHGVLRPFHQKSTCIHAINFRAVCGANVVTLPPGIEGVRIWQAAMRAAQETQDAVTQPVE